MPLIDPNTQKIEKFEPVISVNYNPKSYGFDLVCRRGDYLLDAFLRSHGQPIKLTPNAHYYYVAEIFHKDFLEVMREVGVDTEPLKQAVSRLRPINMKCFVPARTSAGTKLRSYQHDACYRLQQGSLLLGDDLGLGKTLSTIHAWLNEPNGARVMLVVVPNEDVAGDWIECMNTHFQAGDASVCLIRNREDLLGMLDGLQSHNLILVLVPYTRVWRDGYIQRFHSMMKARNTVLVLDEAHRISRVSSSQHRGIYQLAELAHKVWCLSGTEVSNTPDQYFGMYRMLRRPDLSGYTLMPKTVDEDTWISYYRNTEERNQWHTTRLEGLKFLRQAFALRRTKEDVQPELPPLTEIDSYIVMDQTTREIYRGLETGCQAELQRQGNPEVLKEDHFWVIYLRLIQLCSHPLLLGEERVDDTPKWERLKDILEDSVGSQKVIIWSNFPDTINWIADKVRRHFPWAEVEAAHGRVSKADRADIKDRVKAGEVDVVVANPAIWGEGVNLQACTVMVYWDYHPSRVRWKQSQGRCHRMGQTKPVTIYRLLYRNSVDIKILHWLTEKGKLANLITGD